MKVALVYDWLHTFGGAERVILQLQKLFPKAPLFSAVYDKKRALWAKKFLVNTSFLQKFPLAKSHHELYPFLTPLSFESFDFSQFDIVISVTSSDAKGLITKPGTVHICYLLTPTRYLWSHEDFYLRNRLLKFLGTPLIKYLKHWDLIAKNRPDYYIAISDTVKNRAKRFYNIEMPVIYPPVPVKFLSVQKRVITQEKNYYLIVARLVSYKRVDIAIRACNNLGLPLIIVGSGRRYFHLRKIAGQRIKFVGNLTEDQLISYYQNCRAVIVPSEEDFGIVAVEALALGKPVIAYNKGGSAEIIKNGVTGELFTAQTEESLCQILKKFDEKKYSRVNCINSVKKFDESIFLVNFKQFINEVWKKNQSKFQI